MKITTIPPKLAWSCRRGMLELDILLNNYLKDVFLSLDDTKQQQFIEYIENSDQDLYDWLIGQGQPSDPICLEVTLNIRAHASAKR